MAKRDPTRSKTKKTESEGLEDPGFFVFLRIGKDLNPLQ